MRRQNAKNWTVSTKFKVTERQSTEGLNISDTHQLFSLTDDDTEQTIKTRP